MMETASKIPVPEPIAPKKSAKIVKAPIAIPPKAAALGMYLKITNHCLPVKFAIYIFFVFSDTFQEVRVFSELSCYVS